MIALGIDTSTGATAVGLLGRGGFAGERLEAPDAGGRPVHASRLLILAHELLSEAGLSFSDVQRIAVGRGPGTYTGLRIGIATARALSQASEADIVGVSSLAVLAAGTPGGPRRSGATVGVAGGAPPATREGVLALFDARRGEVFGAVYLDGTQRLAARVLTPEALTDLAAGLAGADAAWRAVGEGALRLHDRLQAAGIAVSPQGSPAHQVSARTLCELAVEASPQDLEQVTPEYLRLADAEIARREREKP